MVTFTETVQDPTTGEEHTVTAETVEQLEAQVESLIEALEG